MLSRHGIIDDFETPTADEAHDSRPGPWRTIRGEEALHAGDLASALQYLTNPQPPDQHRAEQHRPQTSNLGRAFIIGGSTLYNEALKLPQTKHVLLTKVHKDFDCDTFFPVDLEGEAGKAEGWQRETKEGLEEFTGEEFGPLGEKQAEGDVEYEYCLFSRD